MPRFLVRRVAGESQHAYVAEGSASQARLDGKGAFDPDLLCEAHEGMLAAADEYGARFIDKHWPKARATDKPLLWSVPNPKPALLVKFAAASVWKRAVSRVRRGGNDLDLGVYERPVRDFVFGHPTTFEPLLALVKHERTLNGEVLKSPMLTEPTSFPTLGRCAAVFHFGDCWFWIKFDPREPWAAMKIFAANQRDPAPVLFREKEDWLNDPGFMDTMGKFKR
jgi:hypothetical protein